jgi:hypothetical protein
VRRGFRREEPWRATVTGSTESEIKIDRPLAPPSASEVFWIEDVGDDGDGGTK